jgi:hypothetical protein
VNIALELSANPGALVSRKYIKLGYAEWKVNKKTIIKLKLLWWNISRLPWWDSNEQSEFILNYERNFKGKAVYKILANENPVLAMNGISLLEHIGKKIKRLINCSH